MIDEILDKIISEIAETDISAYDFKVVNEIVEKYKRADDKKSVKRGNKLNEHEVAEILDELFGHECACDFNGLDEWLPFKCDYADTDCPHVESIKCWEQYLKHRN